MKCKAKSKRTRKPCGQDVEPGFTVCRWHGAGAPQVRRAAALRLLALVDPAIGALGKDLRGKDAKLRQSAARDVLDRAGYRTAERIAVLEVGSSSGFESELERLSEGDLEQLRAIAAKLSDAGGAKSDR